MGGLSWSDVKVPPSRVNVAVTRCCPEPCHHRRFIGTRVPELAKARVDARRQSLFGRDPRQEPASWARSDGVRAAQSAVLMLLPDMPDLFQGFASRPGQVQRIRTPVGRAVPPLDQAQPLELVEHPDQPAREHAQPLAQCLLAEAVGRADDPQDPRMRRLEPQRLQPLREPRGGMGPDLRQQEGGLVARYRGRLRRARPGHSSLREIVIDCNDSRR